MARSAHIVFALLLASPIVAAQPVRSTGPVDPTGTLAGGPPTAKGPKTVGSCDSAYGCGRLKAACTGGDYKYNPISPTSGTCTTSKVVSVNANRLAANVKGQPAAHCFTADLCQKLAARCTGGTFTKGTNNSGTCAEK